MNTAMESNGNRLYQEIEHLLSHDPKLKEAMEVFKISMEEYRKAFAGYSNPPVISTNTTNQFSLTSNL